MDRVSLTSSPYSSELFVLGGCWSASRVFLCVRLRKLGAFGFLWDTPEECTINRKTVNLQLKLYPINVIK